MNGVGAAFTPEMAEGVVAYLARVTEATRPFQTGDTYVNFMELDDASAERVKAAYAPEDFERLVALKDRYDPHNVFRFNRNIAPPKRVEEGLAADWGQVCTAPGRGDLQVDERRTTSSRSPSRILSTGSRCCGRRGGWRSSLGPVRSSLPLRSLACR